MTRFTATTAALTALLATTTLAQAGGIDRNGFNINPLFEEGDYAEFSFSFVSPEVSGTFPANGASSGDMAEEYSAFGFAYRTDLTDQLSLAFVYDDAFGADITYENSTPGGLPAAYPLNNFNATLSGVSAAAYLRYQFDDRISVYGGLRYVVMSAEINFLPGGAVLTPAPTTIGAAETITYEGDGAWGYTLGASYEIPDIALRATVTYNSATDHENAIVNSTGGGTFGPPTGATTSYSLPQSLEVAVQSGVAEGTLVMASVRWTDWSEADIPTLSALGTIRNDDTYTWMLGGARRLSDDFAVVGRVTYEASSGDPASNLAPTDGRIGLSLAGVYDISDQVTLTGGINYTMLGDATSEGFGAQFADNSALGVGFRIGYSF